MSAPQVHIASDYAVLDAGEWGFYYGYEWGYMTCPEGDADTDDAWGFQAKRGDTIVLTLSDKDLATRVGYSVDQLDMVVELLLLGIGLVVAEMGPA